MKRGRPREFDQGAVLEAVTEVFWEKGFSGATLPDLSQAAGITRPSLYTALGDKLSMYLHGLEHARTLLENQLERTLSTDRPLSECLLDLYEASIDQYLSGERPKGCLVVCTASAEAYDEPRIKAALSDILNAIDAALTRRIETVVAKHQPGDQRQAKQAARVAAAVLHSLAVRARAGEHRRHLLDLASAATQSIVALLRLPDEQ